MLAVTYCEQNLLFVHLDHLCFDRTTYDNINGPGGPFMFNIIGPAGPLMYPYQIFRDSTNHKHLQNYLCVTRSLSTRFLLVLTFCEQLLTFFQEENQAKRDERKDHGALDESSLEQQVCESANYTLIVEP